MPGWQGPAVRCHLSWSFHRSVTLPDENTLPLWKVVLETLLQNLPSVSSDLLMSNLDPACLDASVMSQPFVFP